MQLENFNNDNITSSESLILAKFLGKRFTINWPLIRNADMPVLLRYVRIIDLPEHLIEIIIKAAPNS